MCGILGLIKNTDVSKEDLNIEDIIKTLFQLSESRGSDASGIAYSIKKSTTIIKAPEKAAVLTKSIQWNKLFREISSNSNSTSFFVIGHSRLATNGDSREDQNNQPIQGKNSIVIHNGIVVNEDQIFKKYPTLHKKNKTDSELFILLYELFKQKGYSSISSVQKIFSEIYGESNIALADTIENSIILATNTGSIFYVQIHNILIFASEEYFIKRIISKFLNTRLQLTIKNIAANTGVIVQIGCKEIKEFSVTPQTYDSVSRFGCVQNRQSVTSPHVFNNITVRVNNSLNTFNNNSIAKIKSHIPNYKAISHIKRCSKCIMPETMPLITFDRNGICNFCNTYKKQQPLGVNELKKYISTFQTQSSKKNCIVPLSGGRDSSYGLYFVKHILKLNPIAYTYDWGMITDIARRNQSRMCAALGVEHIWVSADIKQKRLNIKKNIEAWLHKPDLGMVTLLMAGDKQAEYYVERLKKQTGINLVIYSRGNQLEDERFKFGYYGIFDGTPNGVIHNLSMHGKFQLLRYYILQFIRNPLYINASLIDSAGAYASTYLMPHDFVYLWHYIKWDEQKILHTLKKFEWETPADTVATWRIDDGTPAFYNYIYYRVQGFTENDGLRSNQIREGVISRKKALELVELENRPRYQSLKWYFDTIGIDAERTLSIIDQIPTLF